MTRIEVALAECERRIEAYKEVISHQEPRDNTRCSSSNSLAMLRIGRDVLTRHVINDCSRNPCPEAQPWLDLLAPEPTP